MWKELVLVASLSGCTVTPTTEIVDVPTYHPPKPLPYTVCSVEWKVYEVDNEPIVGLTYNDNVELAICMKDLLRYIKEQNNIICHYRQDC